MRNVKTLGLTITCGLLSLLPVSALAGQRDRDDHRDDPRHHRYWDDEHHDYHRWNRGENKYWRLYWTPDRGPFVTWEHSNDEQRRAYWHWRHEREEHEHGRR